MQRLNFVFRQGSTFFLLPRIRQRKSAEKNQIKDISLYTLALFLYISTFPCLWPGAPHEHLPLPSSGRVSRIALTNCLPAGKPTPFLSPSSHIPAHFAPNLHPSSHSAPCPLLPSTCHPTPINFTHVPCPPMPLFMGGHMFLDVNEEWIWEQWRRWQLNFSL